MNLAHLKEFFIKESWWHNIPMKSFFNREKFYLTSFIITTENPHLVIQRRCTWGINFSIVIKCEVNIIVKFTLIIWFEKSKRLYVAYHCTLWPGVIARVKWLGFNLLVKGFYLTRYFNRLTFNLLVKKNSENHLTLRDLTPGLNNFRAKSLNVKRVSLETDPPPLRTYLAL